MNNPSAEVDEATGATGPDSIKKSEQDAIAAGDTAISSNDTPADQASNS